MHMERYLHPGSFIPDHPYSRWSARLPEPPGIALRPAGEASREPAGTARQAAMEPTRSRAAGGSMLACQRDRTMASKDAERRPAGEATKRQPTGRQRAGRPGRPRDGRRGGSTAARGGGRKQTGGWDLGMHRGGGLHDGTQMPKPKRCPRCCVAWGRRK
ncbi:hypothetical protein BS78_09G174600 [Paspalum vaginatum]|nr:hypothetical protein BS78_09G174600 [Paspalum vaginatum]